MYKLPGQFASVEITAISSQSIFATVKMQTKSWWGNKTKITEHKVYLKYTTPTNGIIKYASYAHSLETNNILINMINLREALILENETTLRRISILTRQ